MPVKEGKLFFSKINVHKSLPERMPVITSNVKFFEMSSGSLQEGDGHRSGYPAPLYLQQSMDSEVQFSILLHYM